MIDIQDSLTVKNMIVIDQHKLRRNYHEIYR